MVSAVKKAQLEIDCKFLKTYVLFQEAIEILGSTFQPPVGKSDGLLLYSNLCLLGRFGLTLSFEFC